MADIILDVSPEEFEKAGSKFATPGLHLSEISEMPSRDGEKSIKFPFRIIEEGPDNGKEGKISAGISKEGVWKVKEILKGLGVEYKAIKTPKGEKVGFDPAACVGKQFKSLWIEQVDSRTPEEGGKGTKYTKPTAAYPAETDESDIGIG